MSFLRSQHSLHARKLIREIEKQKLTSWGVLNVSQTVGATLVVFLKPSRTSEPFNKMVFVKAVDEKHQDEQI